MLIYFFIVKGGIDTAEVILPSKIHKTPSAASFEGDAYPWAMPGEGVAGSSYSPLQAPQVGPVAFPGVLQRSTSSATSMSEAGNTSTDSQDLQQSSDRSGTNTQSPLTAADERLKADVNCSNAQVAATGTGVGAMPPASPLLGKTLERISAALWKRTEVSPSQDEANSSRTVDGECSSSNVIIKLEPKDSEA
jgi:hypothetical protein